MQIHPRSLFLWCIAALAVSSAAAGTVSVSFVNAPGFADASATAWDKGANQRALAGHLRALGQRHLAAGQVLKVEMLDLDLAGTTRPSRHTDHDLRIVRGMADAPRISLRYTLEEGGQPLRSGEESLTDVNYGRGLSHASGADPLRHEKRMLDDWFKQRFN